MLSLAGQYMVGVGHAGRTCCVSREALFCLLKLEKTSVSRIRSLSVPLI